MSKITAVTAVARPKPVQHSCASVNDSQDRQNAQQEVTALCHGIGNAFRLAGMAHASITAIMGAWNGNGRHSIGSDYLQRAMGAYYRYYIDIPTNNYYGLVNSEGWGMSDPTDIFPELAEELRELASIAESAVIVLNAIISHLDGTHGDNPDFRAVSLSLSKSEARVMGVNRTVRTNVLI